jgi:prophage regulatory protein
MRNHTNAVATTVSLPLPPSTDVAANRPTCDVVRLPETGFLRQPQVLVFVPISRSTLWRRIQAGTFPGPVKLSARVTAWRAEDLRRWIEQQGIDG